MNQMDENYWKQLAATWIQSRQQNPQQNETSCPSPPKISFNTNNQPTKQSIDDNSVTDMDIEDDIKEEQPPPPIWNIQHQNQKKTPEPPKINYHHHQSRFQKSHEPRKTFTPHHHRIPEPPVITIPQISQRNIIEEQHQLNSIDMDMDESDNDNDNDNDSNSASSGNIDVHKKKTLPIWIREGLEKMKREKEMETARIQDELKAKEDEENRKKLMEEALKEIEQEKLRKSKYESSESEDDISKLQSQETEKIPQIPLENDAEDEDPFEKMMLLVRKTLTTILLETTNEKIQEISSETLSKYRKKASASTTNNKPAIIGLGLGVYSSSSDSDEDSADDEKNANISDWEPESVLKERIRQKAISFEKRTKDIKERLAKIAEIEEEIYKKKSHKTVAPSPPQISSMKTAKKGGLSVHSDSEDERPKFKSDNKDGEEKYEQIIYSISASSASGSRMREKKTRFSDMRDRSTAHMTTHVSMIDTRSIDNGSSIQSAKIIPPPPPITSSHDSPKKDKDKKKKRRNSSAESSSSSDSSRRKKHKKHKKRSKKSSKKRDRSKSRSRSREKQQHHKSDRQSIESKSSVRSSESRSKRSTRSRSRSRDRHRRRY